LIFSFASALEALRNALYKFKTYLLNVNVNLYSASSQKVPLTLTLMHTHTSI